MTYDDLKAQILAFVNRIEIEPMIPGLVALAEAELQRLLKVRPMVGRATATLNGEYELLPADFAGAVAFELSADPPRKLERRSADELAQLRGVHAEPGAPVYYAVIGAELRFCPTPDQAYPGSQLTYWRKIPVLGPLQGSNWLLEAHPDAYLYGALKQAGQMLGDARGDGWAARFDRVVAEIASANPVEEGLN